MTNNPGSIRVLSGVLRPPMVDTQHARIIEFRDAFGDLEAAFSWHDGLGWLFSTQDDPMWPFTLSNLNYLDTQDRAMDMLNIGAGEPGRIRVLTSVTGTPLLVTHEATLIEYRNYAGELLAVFSRHFSDDMWIMVACGDEDWETELVRLGYSPAKSTIRDAVADVITKVE